VKEAPFDTAGFEALSESQRRAWDHAVGIYQVHASPLDIGYGSLVDVNYAVADLPAREVASKTPRRSPPSFARPLPKPARFTAGSGGLATMPQTATGSRNSRLKWSAMVLASRIASRRRSARPGLRFRCGLRPLRTPTRAAHTRPQTLH
jgi:hypothetical protein